VLTGIVQPYILAFLSSAAVAKLTMVYPLPPITDVLGLYRTARLLSQRLRPLAFVAIASNVVNSVMVSHSQDKAAALLYKKLTETHVFI